LVKDYKKKANDLKEKDHTKEMAIIVATLALGSLPKQGLTRLLAKEKPGNEKKCEGMNPHTPKGAFTLGVGVPMDF